MLGGGAPPDVAGAMLEKGFEYVTDLKVSWLGDVEDGFVVDPNKPVLPAGALEIGFPKRTGVSVVSLATLVGTKGCPMSGIGGIPNKPEPEIILKRTNQISKFQTVEAT